jgi:parvulin-like peptidyl-prolyl isomerase
MAKHFPARRNYLCLLPFAFCVAAAAEVLQTFNGPAVKVNTQVVSIREVETVFADSRVLIDDKLRRGELRPDALEQAIRTAWTEALETAVQDRIIDQHADKRRKDIIHSYLAAAGEEGGGDRALDMFRRLEDTYIRKLRRELIAAAGGEDELRAALKRRGQTFQEWENNLSRELFRRDVIALELGPVTVSPAAIREYYSKHPDEFQQAEAWRLRRIRIVKAQFSAPDVALQAARLAKEKALQNNDFAEAASKVSDDPEFAKGGGLLTRGDKTDLPSGNFPVEEDLARKLKDGEISDPVDAGDWYILVQRAGYRAAKMQSLEEAAEKAQALAFAEKLKQKKREMYQKLKAETYIEVIQKDPPAHLLDAGH